MVETEIERLSKGTFKKCDMHLHSSSCYSRSYNREAFINAILESDLDVVAVTDHNSIDTELLSNLEAELSVKDKTLIGGVELNVRLREDTILRHHLTLGKGSKGEYFHAIVLFDMKDVTTMAEIVDRLFQKSLTTDCGTDVQSASQTQMSRKAISRKTEGTAIYLEEFQEEVAAIPHFFIPHENKDRSLSDYLPNAYPANLSYKDRLFYYSHAMAVEGGAKSRKHISAGIADELHTTVAALFFSDAKTIEKIGSRFTWIDFDGDLDSLLLAISDPESRIRTSDECLNPPQTNTDVFLESVTFNTYEDGDTSTGRATTLHFSPGYNGIVGSRGSGKTLLACLLANRGLDTYSEFVDADSARFTLHGGVPTNNRPQCLYLGQGELEDIYKGGHYEEIPFLGERISPLKREAERESEEAASRFEGLVSLSKSLLTAFCEKYRSGVVRIDHFDTEMPSGITLEIPAFPPDDEQQTVRARALLEEARNDLAGITEKTRAISFVPSYREDSVLFDALEAEARGVQDDVYAITERIERFAGMLGSIDSTWFERRKELISLFSKTLTEHNSSSGSTMLSQYMEQTKRAASFLDDLLMLRMYLKHLDGEAQNAFERMHKPVPPVKLQNSNEPIEIALVYDDDSTYESKVAELIGAASSNGTQVLAEAFLHQSNRAYMHKIFNGNKFRSCKDSDFKTHYEKFYDLVKSAAKGTDNLKTHITIAGEPIDTMSPGMKAQALLKLFLNDSVTSGKWTYVVLDQPEDNLDVATIKEFLISRLKQLKLNVQFFIVSHSAPVIVNGDARTIVICKNHGKRIGYTYGPLNGEDVKQSIADVLDGGELYLKMRLNKYNFKVEEKK